MKENRRKSNITDIPSSIREILLLIVAMGVVYFIVSTYFIPSSAPTVYMTYGDTNTCVKAENAQGKSISCAEAKKGGRYHVVYIAPKTLNEE